MPKRAISVTLRRENVLWLRGQMRVSSRRSVSETLDELISRARAGAHGASPPATSVVGSISILPSDPGLMRADAIVRRLFSGSRPAATGRPRSRGVARSRARRA
jgi:hypothetical protein